ncbi:amino acid deaminase/aldolase [Aeromicrobium sp.]|uniref:amino acid deaminase/aldolase n=1 Tax=Aeromicrobium sp. TaxID=1871063 RepID=UPI0025C47812|nr:amino acid deaminase/aldolase [Aeromicrobium sp.]MCK5892114.1 amino acid deaminase/aldolase [Aeromicrobium sp.]
MTDPAHLLHATRELPAPLALLDGAALEANLADLARRAHGVPVRVATKSVRVRAVIDQALAHEAFQGLMTYSLAESLWLADLGHDDILLAYPSVNAPALRDLAAEQHRRDAITVMVDSLDSLDAIDGVLGVRHPTIRVCLDVDASLRLGPIHLGVRRSPVHTAKQARRVAEAIARRPGFELVGVMFYDAQIAGLPDTSPAVRLVKKRSAAELAERRSAVVETVRAVADLELVNAGGTGSLEVTGQDPAITELTAGSGLFCPTLFDGYDAFEARPAAFFALDVVRRPARGIATCFSGGYIASGPAGDARVPTPVFPEGLTLIGTEGTGEVQTPLTGKAARMLRPGDRVLFRHAKAGEMCERFDAIHVVDAAGPVTSHATYRGEGKNFG